VRGRRVAHEEQAAICARDAKVPPAARTRATFRDSTMSSRRARSEAEIAAVMQALQTRIGMLRVVHRPSAAVNGLAKWTA
jgi:hypothetical protein